ncbi:hypothetical protein [Streptomyces sp. NPDC048489]|uniref:hypothetical protein n=1 Tax=Streptomyces sp. NPDC048489 TaxID=3154504 RepID=UPI00342B23C9
MELPPAEELPLEPEPLEEDFPPPDDVPDEARGGCVHDSPISTILNASFTPALSAPADGSCEHIFQL